MKFRALCVFLVGCWLASSSIFIPANAVDSDKLSTAGISLSAVEFSARFSGLPENRQSSRSFNTFSTPEITLSNISISDTTLSLTASLKANNELIILPICGTLKASYKAQQGINSVIVEVQRKVRGYDVLLFEIFNDTADDQLFFGSTDLGSHLANSPHIKLYLRDQESDIFLFESVLPKDLIGLNADDYSTANAYKDLYWAWDLVAHNTARLPINSDDSPFVATSSPRSGAGVEHTQHFPEVFYDSFYLLEDFYESYSLPYIKYSYSNVATLDGTWYAVFKVAERVEMNGTIINTGNAFSYHNVKIAFAGGSNTRFIRTYQSGTLLNSVGSILRDGANIVIDLLKSTSSHSATFLAALECISSMVSTTKSTKLGTEGVTLLSGSVTAVGESFYNYYLTDSSDNGGQHIKLQAVTQSNNATSIRDTIGALVVEFDVECGATITASEAFEIQLNYTVYPY